MGVSELSRQIGVSKAVVHRILQSLVAADLLKFDSGTRNYSLGAGAALIGARAMRQLDIREVARGELIELRNATEETATLSVLVADQRTYIDQFESPRQVKMTVELGRLFPLYAGASSRVILAFLSAVEIDRILQDGLRPLTPDTVIDEASLRQRLDEIRAKRYTLSRGERQHDAASIAAPLFGYGERVLGSISLCGPLSRFDETTVQGYIPLVVDTANRISERLSRVA